MTDDYELSDTDIIDTLEEDGTEIIRVDMDDAIYEQIALAAAMRNKTVDEFVMDAAFEAANLVLEADPKDLPQEPPKDLKSFSAFISSLITKKAWEGDPA